VSNCTLKNLKFPAIKRRNILANFGGGEITSDGGVLLLRQIEQQRRLLEKVAVVIPDNRDKNKVEHSVLTMLQQRVFGIALGYEDLNDHKTLRNDIAFQTSVNSDSALASSSTLCRFENSATNQIAFDINKIFVEEFISSQREAPKELILDFDATDDIVHGDQVGKYFHGYYENYCFLPLYIFCEKKLLVSYLRTSDKDGARHAWAILSLLAKRFRAVWPNVKIVFRGDSGFCRHQMFDWCERKNVDYITGIARNPRLEKKLAPKMLEAKTLFEEKKEKQRLFTEFMHSAESWSREQRVNCARGEMENRIKEQQQDLFADRTSCHEWWPNQFRLLLSSLAYIMIEYLRTHALIGTELEKAQVGTIRLKLFKIGAVIVKNTRKILFLMSSHYPYQQLFGHVVNALSSA
jgi:hypothetical protein